MTKTYHDVEAVTRLLEEKEKDLELAAKIGQELLERNKGLDEKVSRLELELAASNELIIQLRHELQVKTDLLHVYSSDLEDSSPLELRSINVDILQKKIQELEQDNRKLHAEASKLAQEAYACEEKEEKLVSDAVKHLTQANYQIKDLHDQFTVKVDESSRQREEISSLLAQVCDLQSRVQRFSHENDDLTANLRVYQETQDELTYELADLKEKYREVVDLLREAQEQLKFGRKRTYPGMGRHSVSGMFSAPRGGETAEDSLQAEINSSLQSSKKASRTHSKLENELTDSDNEIPMIGSSSYRKVARTFKAIARSSARPEREGTAAPPPATGQQAASRGSIKSAFQSYTISRENSFSPDFEDFEFNVKKFDDDIDASDDSGHGRSTEMSGPHSLSSSAPREEFKARELLRQATRNRHNSSQSNISTGNATMHNPVLSTPQVPSIYSQSPAVTARAGLGGGGVGKPSRFMSLENLVGSEKVEVVEVQTVGELKRPTFHLSSTLLQATPLGHVPGRNGLSAAPTAGPASMPATPCGGPPGPPLGGHPALGTIPGRRFSENVMGRAAREASDYDETEPLGSLTSTQVMPGLGSVPGHNGSSNSLYDDSEYLPLTIISSATAGSGIPGAATGMPSTMMSSMTTMSSSGYATGGRSSVLPLGLVDGNLRDLAEELGGGFGEELGSGNGDFDETEPIQSLSLTSTLPLSRKIECQIMSKDGPAGESMEGNSVASYDEWSYSDLDPSSEFISDDQLLENETSSFYPLSPRLRSNQPGADSGVTSGDFSESRHVAHHHQHHQHHQQHHLDHLDSMSDGGFSELGTYPGLMAGGRSNCQSELGGSCGPTAGFGRQRNDSCHMEDSYHVHDSCQMDSNLQQLTSALQGLNPAEVERRRRLMARTHSMDLVEDCSVAGYEDEYGDPSMLPYGVQRTRTPDSLASRYMGSSMSGRLGMRFPDKLRIVKPIEGSLTLHNWSRLATPHLGGVLEERVGVAIKGNEKAGLDPLFDMYGLQEEEEEDEEDLVVPSVREPTRTYNTITNSTVLHPDVTFTSSVYGRTQMSSGFPSRDSTRPPSRLSSRRNSVSETGSRYGVSTFSTNIGLARLLNERNISGVRGSQLDLRSGGTSLTPSVLASPQHSRNLSPTSTPPHTPQSESPSGSPEDDNSSAGIVSSFFASLKSAIYGEQRKQERSSRQRRRMESRRAKLGILEAVEEVGLEAFLSDRESTPGSLPSLEGYDMQHDGVERRRSQTAKTSSSSSGSKSTVRQEWVTSAASGYSGTPGWLSDFDARYLGALDDFDELEDIEPGFLTNRGDSNWKEPSEYTKSWIGQLTVPTMTVSGRPTLETSRLGQVPESTHELSVPGYGFSYGGRGPGRIVSPGEVRPSQLTGLGVPGHPGTGAIGHAMAVQRRDLGTIPGQSTAKLRNISSSAAMPRFNSSNDVDTARVNNSSADMPRSDSFVGSITSFFFGRKGGLL